MIKTNNVVLRYFVKQKMDAHTKIDILWKQNDCHTSIITIKKKVESTSKLVFCLIKSKPKLSLSGVKTKFKTIILKNYQQKFVLYGILKKKTKFFYC